MAPPFEKLLVANRGEIAVRIIRACHEMGIRTVAVFSEADRDALHVRYAHEAYAIGPPPSSESYLRIDTLLDVAKRSGAGAVHPGYGFLSENPAFARACGDAGIVFVGPTPEAIEAMGDKVRSRELMTAAGIPVVPGSPPLAGVADAEAHAARIGYPVLLKASAGGGGRGMRVVRGASELPSLLAQARGEARSAFGDETIFLEKYVERPRHIEVQVLADAHGRCVHLGERECSIQRRHQKLVEEAPSPVIDPDTRERIGAMAVAAAKACGYVSAGTVEMLRAADGAFYFMEMNTRLQVEHPVTEAIYGVDLVKAMIGIAAGGALPWRQEDLVSRGHAIECRILAEDPARGFVPAPGTIRALRAPAGPGVRYDGGVYGGFTVPVHYDPLLAKLVTWGRDRAEAAARMARALDELRVDGVKTSIVFHRRLMTHPAFLAGDLHTGFLAEHPDLAARGNDPWLDEVAVLAAGVAHFRRMEQLSLRGSRPSAGGRRGSDWRRGARTGWRR
ncbi:MAG TPA: acetyl-CoA carboxylase biotin carboxylase subunit [Candidatus Polarisedimenticolaceae bacterium]|nr:acetyl-CoA carboxylase biotin carboxylase subunit [Candidatus Polarisedimenticolaceae bacterium]